MVGIFSRLTYAGFKELAAYSLVHSDGFGNFLHISTGGLTQSTDAVYAADSLGQKGISCLQKNKKTVLDLTIE